MSSLISKKPLTEYGTQPYGPPCGSIISVCTIEQLYDKATSAVQMNDSIGEWFRTTVGVRQGCLLSPTLFNIFLERIMSDALEEHYGKVSIGGGNITNLRFADDIDALAEEEQKLEALVESLDKTCTRNKMEISAEKTKLMTNSANDIQREIKVKGQKLGTVTSFKYLRAVVSDDNSKPVSQVLYTKPCARVYDLMCR